MRISAGVAALLFWLGAPSAALAQSVDHTAAGSMVGEPVTAPATGQPQRASEAP